MNESLIPGATNAFKSIYSHGLIRSVVCISHIRVAEPRPNAAHTLALARRSSDLRATVALFPELGTSAYSNEDLFHQDALLDASAKAIGEVVEASRNLCPILIVGAPPRPHILGNRYTKPLCWSVIRQKWNNLSSPLSLLFMNICVLAATSRRKKVKR